MCFKSALFTYFWQAALAVASLYAIYVGVSYENGVWWLMAVPLLAAVTSIWLVRRYDLDLSRYFARRTLLTLINAAIIVGICIFIPDLFFGLILNYLAPIPLIIMLFINVRYFIAKCENFHECLALTLSDPLHFCTSYLLIIYFSVILY